MERNYYNEGFESFLREKTDEYKLYPSDKVWGQIQRKLHPRRKWPFLAAALLLLGIGVGTRYMVEDMGTAPVSEQGQGGKRFSNTPDFMDSERLPEAEAPGTGIGSSMLSVASLNPSAGNTPYSAPSMKVVDVVQSPINDIETSSTPASVMPETPGSSPAEFLPYAFHGPIRNFPMASVEKSSAGKLVVSEQFNSPSKLNTIISQVSRVGRKSSWQMYFSPTVSYRRLVGQASKYIYPYSGFPYSANYGFAKDVNEAVRHRPAVGMELGTALLYPLNRNLRVKAGLQFNFNSYQIEAYSYVPELASFGSNGPGSYANAVSTTAYYRNFNGFDRTMLKNSHFMISIPLGLELTLLGNDRIKFNVASTIQPTYVINNEAYLVSTNLKNYAQEPSLYRKWNVNAGAEAFVSVNTGSYSWVIGPQFRYQIMSSYKNKYPIKEHLVDYGFKIGVNKRLK
jgi:hypothetical protein